MSIGDNFLPIDLTATGDCLLKRSPADSHRRLPKTVTVRGETLQEVFFYDVRKNG